MFIAWTCVDGDVLSKGIGLVRWRVKENGLRIREGCEWRL